MNDILASAIKHANIAGAALTTRDRELTARIVALDVGQYRCLQGSALWHEREGLRSAWCIMCDSGMIPEDAEGSYAW